MKRTPSPQNQEPDQEIIDLLKRLESHKVEYPPELLAARRADFVAKAKQVQTHKTKQGLSNGHFTKRLKELQSVKAEYPPELLAARRAAFVAQVEQRSAAAATEELSAKDQELVKLFNAIKSAETKSQYPPKLMAARRSAFNRQIALGGGVSLLETLRSSIKNLFAVKMPSIPTTSLLRTSLILAFLVVAAFATSLLRNREPVLSPAPTQENVSQPVSSATETPTAEVVTIVCKPGEPSPMCPPEEVDKSTDLALQGNGAAKPAVAKDTVVSNNGVHRAANVNDGHDGGGWVSSSENSWIKIDLGKVATINTVSLNKSSLPSYKEHKLGQFVIAVALSDVYAEGNSSNDYTEYTQVYDSQQTDFSGVVSETATVRAMFKPVRARYVKIIFKEAGTAINEIKVFMAQPFGLIETPTRRPKEDAPSAASTPVPVYNTAVPTDPPPTEVPPTRTPVPTDPPPTEVPPTRTPVPTDPPPTDIPPTSVPPTDIPPTEVPPTSVSPVDTPILLYPIDTSQPTTDPSTPAGGS